MKNTPNKPNRKQIGVRIDHALTVEAKILALRTGQGLNDLVEEAMRDLIKKYRGKA
jgi:predicted HicB family RNase H-like nuclease